MVRDAAVFDRALIERARVPYPPPFAVEVVPGWYYVPDAETCAKLARWRAHIEKHSIPVPFAGCWLWLAGVGSHGYGATRVPGSSSTSATTAPRLAFLAWNGPLLPGEVPRHTCHVKLCCNPDHLIAGSQHENMQDSAELGVLARKLTRAQVLRIHELAEQPRQTHRSIAAELGVSHKTVWMVLHGKTWTRVTKPR